MAEQSNSELINYGRKKKKGVVPMVLVVALIVGLLVGALSFFFAYRYMISDSEGEIPEDTFSANDMADQVLANLIGSDIDAVVKSVDKDNKTITFYNLKKETVNTVTVNEESTLPADVTFDTIKIGDIYTYVFNEDKSLDELKECKDAWTVSDVGLAISTSAKLVKFTGTAENNADTSYKYIEGLTTVRYKNDYSTLEKVSPLDYVELRGYKNGGINRVYSITILKSHGELQFQNINAIDDVVVEINGDKHEPDRKDPRILLTEGTYNIKISGSNCEPVTKTVTIDSAAPFTIDLAKIIVKSGVLNVSANVTDYKVYINNKEYTGGELLEYGTYDVIGKKDGYVDAKVSVVIDSDTNSCNLSFEKIDKSGTIGVSVSPSDAQIYIDGTLYGTGSITQKLPLGSYIVSASADGYNTSKKQVNITAVDQQIPVTFTLTPVQ